MKFAYEANAWGGVIGTAGAVTNLGSGFYETPGDIRETVKAIAAAGYTGLELFDGNLLPFEDTIADFTSMVRDGGLEVAGVYSGGQFIYPDAHEDELARFDRSIGLAAAVGARQITLFGVTRRERTGPWSPDAVCLGSHDAWPDVGTVVERAMQMLDNPVAPMAEPA